MLIRAFRRIGSERSRSAAWSFSRLRTVAILLTFSLVGWTVAIFWFDNVPYALLNESAYAAVESAGLLALLFGALALFLFPEAAREDRMRWVATGLGVLAIGGIAFTFVFHEFANTFSANERLFASFFVRTTAAALMLVGLATNECPRFTIRRVLIALASVTAAGSALLLPFIQLPVLTEARLAYLLYSPAATNLANFSFSYWVLSLIPLALVVTLLLRLPVVAISERLRAMLTIGLILFAGSHVHNMIWPSIYSQVVTTADVLRIGFAGTVLFGAILGLQEVARERATRIAEEREYARRLRELQTLRADFSRMVAHELSHPLAAIRRYADILGHHGVDHEQRQRLLAGIQHESEMLRTLIADVHAASTVDQEHFGIQPRPFPLQVILNDAEAFAQTLPHSRVNVSFNDGATQVWADPERIAQVMRNLLTNAVKFSPPNTLVEISATRTARSVRVSVRDEGPGIQPEDQRRIFEKFARVKSAGQQQPGLGLGLYIAQRILGLHGTTLALESIPGRGTTFSFELPVAD